MDGNEKAQKSGAFIDYYVLPILDIKKANNTINEIDIIYKVIFPLNTIKKRIMTIRVENTKYKNFTLNCSNFISPLIV